MARKKRRNLKDQARDQSLAMERERRASKRAAKMGREEMGHLTKSIRRVR